jgi:hypothetical protein
VAKEQLHIVQVGSRLEQPAGELPSKISKVEVDRLKRPSRCFNQPAAPANRSVPVRLENGVFPIASNAGQLFPDLLPKT